MKHLLANPSQRENGTQKDLVNHWKRVLHSQ